MKLKLQAQEMSVMIGAGFSKNVNNDLYPTWWGLLRDMVKMMHGKSFRTDYENVKPIAEEEEIENFINAQCDRYINEVGPLNVASKYMELRGYRESVDAYIELRTPYIVNKDRKKYLKYFVNEEPKELLLSDSDLSAHRKLVNLPWNNIYTTNYDNLLEESIDQNIEDEIKRQINDIKARLIELESNNVEIGAHISCLKAEIENLADENSAEKLLLSNDGRSSESEKSYIEDTKFPSEENKKKEELENHIYRHQIEIEVNVRQIKFKEIELSKLKSLSKSYPSLVIRSSQLALKRTRNIIKLHGSRRTENNTVFGFDDDARKQYVLTREDFDTYPVKHEAFTQLMRISLLQESFCLIGFSGEDPNFLAWIGWVRDVLFKDKKESIDGSPEKIYLISVSKLPEKKESDFGKSIFYQNQRIAEIPLQEDDCIDFLEEQTGQKLKDRSSKKGALNLLFDYLQNASSLTGPQLTIELSHRTRFNQLCDKLPKFAKDIQIGDVVDNLSTIDTITKYNRFPSLAFSYDVKRQWFLNQSDVYLDHVKDDLIKLEIYLRAVSVFLRAQLYPLSIFATEQVAAFEKMVEYAKIISPILYGEFLLLKLKDAIWTDSQQKVKKIESELLSIEDDGITNERQYLIALYALLQCDFYKLEKVLLGWEATDYWVIKKAGLLSNLNKDGAVASLLDSQMKIVQEYLYMLELNKYLNHSLSSSDSQKLEEFRSLKDSGLNTISNSADYLLNEIKEKEVQILPYGEDKFTVKNSIFLSNSNKYLQSMQFVGLMLESGYPFSTFGSPFKPSHEVYPAMKNVLKYYWLPVVQSALQFSDTKFVKRMAQDFILCSYGKPVFQKATKYLQSAYFSDKTLYYYKQNILVFLTELANVVNPKYWEPFFLRVWNQKLEEQFERSDRRESWFKYLKMCLNLIQTPTTFSQVIKEALHMYKNERNLDFAIMYLYELASNTFLKIHAQSIIPSIDHEINQIISAIHQQPNSIFLLGNIEVLLSSNHKDLLYNELGSFDFQSVTNVRLWKVILYFTKNDVKLMDKIKSAILKNKSLWDAGFINNGVTHRDFIPLHTLRKNDDYPGLLWNCDEILEIYGRLLDEFAKIEKFLKKRRDREFFNDVLEEMRYFLKDEASTLIGIAGYNEMLEKVIVELNGQRAFDDAFMGIISNDQNKVLRALDEIVLSIYEMKDWSSTKVHLDILANKVMLQKGPAVEACLNALSVVVFDFREHVELQQYIQTLVSILIQFRDSPLENGDQPFIEERLVRIAYVLNKWQVQDEVIKYYLKRLKSSQFNNIKYNLANLLSR